MDKTMEERSAYRSVELGDEDLLRQHPADIFGRLLAESPVHKGSGRRFGDVEFPALWPDFEGDTYLVLSYDGISQVLKSEHISSDIHQRGAELVLGRSLFCLDPPEQTRARRLLFAGLTPTQVTRWEETAIRPAVDAALDAVAGRDRFDLVREVTEVFPYRTITRILGLPGDVGEWAADRVVDLVRAVSDPAAAFRAAMELGEYLRGYIEEKRADPKDDFISVLLQAEVEDGRPLEAEELMNFVRHVLMAGIETTFRTAGILMTHLLLEPGRWEEVVADRSLIPYAIDEALRLDPPANYFPRKTTADITVEGVTIPVDHIIYVAITAANRDPSRWERPDEFDLHRPMKPHLSFSVGPHTCIGMHLGKRELTIFIDRLADRYPHLRLDPDAPPPVIEGWMLRSVNHLPVVVR